MRAAHTATCSEMLRRRMPSAQSLFLANGQGERAIEFERVNSGATNRTESEHLCAFPAEVKSPGVLSRIEKPDLLARGWVNRGLFGPLSQRTGHASKGQIACDCAATSGERNDVINVEGRLLAALGKAAVFATVSRSLNHLPSQWSGNKHGVMPRASSSAASATGAARASRPDQPSLRLRSARRSSAAARRLVCRAGSAAAYVLLSAGGSAPSRP